MTRLFIIADTHTRLVPPPPWADVSSHLGDCIDVFAWSGHDYAEHLKVFRRYDHQVIGNHEEISFNGFSFSRAYRPEQLPPAEIHWLRQQMAQVEKAATIDGVRIRMSHCLDADPIEVAGAPNTPEIEKGLMNRLSARHDLVLFGHTHLRSIRKIEECVFVNPGVGEEGEYAEIVIESGRIARVILGGL